MSTPTPGRTLGTISPVFDVRWHGQTHRVVEWGGTGFNFGADFARLDAYIASTARMRDLAKQQNIDGSYRVTVVYTKATFTTIAGPSPESCEAGTANTVAAGITGHFTGSEILNVQGGTFNPTPACASNCSTDAFVAAAFGGSATYTFADYFFEYGIHKNQGCGIDWVDAQTGDGGDIATTCAP